MLRGDVFLLREIPNMLGLRLNEFLAMHHIAGSTWRRWVNHGYEGFNPTVYDFVSMCNRFHLPAFQIIEPSDKPAGIKKAEKVFPVEKKFKNISFEHSAFIGMFGERGELNLPIKKIMERIQKNEVTFHNLWKNSDTCSIRLQDLFLFCDEFKLDINKFIKDPNGLIENGLNQAPVSSEKTSEKIKNQKIRINQLEEEMAQLRKTIAEERGRRMIAEMQLEELKKSQLWQAFGSMIASEEQV